MRNLELHFHSDGQFSLPIERVYLCLIYTNATPVDRPQFGYTAKHATE